MTKIAYLDCPTGIAGDMCLGALVDAGVPLDYLIAMLARLGIANEYHLWAERVQRNGQQATKVHVDLSLDTVRQQRDDRVSAQSQPDSNDPTHCLTEQPATEQPAAELAAKTEIGAIHPHAPSHSHQSHSHQAHSHSHSHSHQSHSHSHADGTVDTTDRHQHERVRHLPEVERLIVAAGLPTRAEAWSLAVFRRLAAAEGAIHGVPPEQVHFHEVGATDAIVDIVGTCLGLDWLGIDRLYCSPLPTGGGTIRAAHGRLPVPAPAVLKLFELRQVPIYSNGIEREMVTPTGAAIATTLATQFGTPPAMLLLRVGLGAGSISLPLPNILRLWLGEEGGEGESAVSGQRSAVSSQWSAVSGQQLAVSGQQSAVSSQRSAVSRQRSAVSGQQSAGSGQQSVVKVGDSISQAGVNDSLIPPQSGSKLHPSSLIPHPSSLIPHPHPTPHTPHPIALLETQIDDLNPQAIGYIYDALFAVGALDVFTQAIGMKKTRPGVLLTVVCQQEDVSACEAVMFRETTTLGIRRSLQQRSILEREMQVVETEYGAVHVKVAWRDRNDAQPTNVQPEYEDCARLARQQQLPWREIHRIALQTWHQQRG